MSAPTWQSHDAAFRETITAAGERLETLRQAVERHGSSERHEMERILDTLRGLRNRAMARVESARQTSEEGRDFARARAEQAIGELLRGLDALEAELSRAAA